MPASQIWVPCPTCGEGCWRSPSSAGMEVTCQSCKTGFRVPEGMAAPPGPGPQPLMYARPPQAPIAGYVDGVVTYDAYGRRRQNLGQQMAKASWCAPLIGFALNSCVGRTSKESAYVAAITSFILYLAGLVLGIVALCTMRKYGRRGVMVSAIVGVCLNGVLVALFAAVFLMLLTR